MPEKLKILLLYDYTKDASTIDQHVNCFKRSCHDVTLLGTGKYLPSWLNVDYFDVVIIHYSIVMCMDSYLARCTREKIKRFRGLKACFIQDEYRFVNKTIETIKYMGLNIIFTCVPETEIEKVYPEKELPGIKKVNVLTGYVPEDLKKYPYVPCQDRSIDVSYRSREVPAYLGELGQEKTAISARFKQDAEKYNLVTDIECSEETRIYGEKWFEFLSHSKACLGTESGASVFDFSGEIQRKVEAHIFAHPDASFEELRDLYFQGLEGKIYLNQISPRCFEASCLRTLMILYEGNYSGVLKPWDHYVPLKKDHSNMEEIVEVLRDPARIEEITARCYQEVALNPAYSYDTLVSIFDENINEKYKELKNLTSDTQILIGDHFIVRFLKWLFISPSSVYNFLTRIGCLKLEIRAWLRKLIYFIYYLVFGVLLRNISPRKVKIVKAYAKRYLGQLLLRVRV